MLFSTSKEGIKTAFQYFVKLPFSKYFLHRLNEIARGKCIAYFSLHRVLEDSAADFLHPHLLNKTAITLKQAHRLLTHINQKLPFISLLDSLEFLKGRRPLNQSAAVLLIEVPYVKTIRLLKPLLEEHRIPATIVVNTESLYDGQMPWMDEIIYRIGSTSQKELSVNFMDQAFSLCSRADRIDAANHLIDHLSCANLNTLRARIIALREMLSETAIPPISERIATIEQLEKLMLNSLFSLACAGKYRLPLFDASIDEAKTEIIDAIFELKTLFNPSLNPVYFYSAPPDKRRQREIISLMIEHDLQAAIGKSFGLCRPGDNMFRLMRLPLAPGSGSFEQFELQGLFDAIDELLMITLAKEEAL
jgi:hypothetical protein